MPSFGFRLLGVLLVFQLSLYFHNLYNLNSFRRTDINVIRIAHAIGSASLLLGVSYVVFPGLIMGRGVFFISIVLVTMFVGIFRIVFRRNWNVTQAQNVVIVGLQSLAVRLAEELDRRKDLAIRLAGFVDDNSAGFISREELLGIPVLGSIARIGAIVDKHRIDALIIAVENPGASVTWPALVKLKVDGVRVEDGHSVLTALTGSISLRTVSSNWFVFADSFHRSTLRSANKRAFDLAVGVVGFLLSSPLMLLTAIAVKLDSPGPILYRQTRVGLKGTHFKVLKFRSMRVNAEAGGLAQWAIENDSRVTGVGKFIRKFRLDELPQFINIIRGEMSFVGPRPERPYFVEQLREKIPHYDERHSTRPGLTGWAQIRYHYGSTFDDAVRKLEYDLFYLQNMSLIFDLLIGFQTIRTVLTGAERVRPVPERAMHMTASAGGAATVPHATSMRHGQGQLVEDSQ